MIFRTIRTKPKNDQFFKTYASLMFALSTGLILTQLISASTESNAIFITIRESLALMPKFTKTVFAWIGTIMGVSLIELYGVRRLLPYSIDAVIYRKFKGEEKHISIFTIILCLVIYLGSFYLSVHGGKDYADRIIIENQQGQNEKQYNDDSKNEIDKNAELENARKSLYDFYVSDSIALASTYDSKISQQKNLLNRTKYGKKYLSIKGEIDRLNVENSQSMLDLKNKFNQEWNDEKQRILKKYVYILDSKKKTTEPNVLFNKKQGEKMKSYTVVFVTCCMLFQLFASIIMRIILKGAGIEEQSVVSQSWFDSSKYEEWSYILNQRFDSLFKNKIRGFDSKTKVFGVQYNNNGYDRHAFDTERVSPLTTGLVEKSDTPTVSEENHLDQNDTPTVSEENHLDQNDTPTVSEENHLDQNDTPMVSEENQSFNIIPRRTITRKIEDIDVELKQCTVCSDFFASKRGTHKYCSSKCKVAAGNMLRKIKRLNGHNPEKETNESQLVAN